MARRPIRLILVPLELRDANEAVRAWHRHHGPVRGCRFCIGAADDSGALVGVAIIGRPIARHYQDGWTAEVLRCATDGTPNTPSCLYAASWRAWRAMGGLRLITYTLTSEPGTSLRAAGWRILHQTRAESWNRPARARVDKHPTVPKMCWEIAAD